VKILIIEFNDYHEEVILSQLNFLDKVKNIDVHLFLNENLKKKINFNKFFNNININFINSKNKWTKFMNIFKIKNYILQNKIDIVIFNTLEDKYSLILANFLKNIKKIAIIHNVDIFLQNNLNKKMDAFFVLNETIYKNIKNQKQNIHISFFYPLFEYTKNCQKINKSNKLRIVIPGLIEFTRRDYLGLLDILKGVKLQNIEFIILGNIDKLDGPLVYNKIQEYKLTDCIKVYHGFIPYKEYFSVLLSADLIMPLIHPNNLNYEKYHQTKITAAFTMAFSFKIPLLLYKSFESLSEYKEFSFFYDLKNLSNMLKSLKKEDIERLKNKMRTSKKISFDYQKKRYINFLRNIK